MKYGGVGGCSVYIPWVFLWKLHISGFSCSLHPVLHASLVYIGGLRTYYAAYVFTTLVYGLFTVGTMRVHTVSVVYT